MANIKSAKKRARQNIVRNERNRMARSSVRTFEKKLLKSIEEKDAKTAQELLISYESKVSKAANKNIYHARTAARKVGRLSKQVAAIS